VKRWSLTPEARQLRTNKTRCVKRATAGLTRFSGISERPQSRQIGAVGIPANPMTVVNSE
jgi:hypothetical protein